MTHRSVGIKNPPLMFSPVPRCELVLCTAAVLHWIKFMCAIEACVAAAGLLYLTTGWLDHPSPDQVLERICPFLVMPWRGTPSQSDIFPFLSFSRKTTKKGYLLNSLAPGVERRVLDFEILHVFLINTNPGFLASVLCAFLSSSFPSASLGHHLTHS